LEGSPSFVIEIRLEGFGPQKGNLFARGFRGHMPPQFLAGDSGEWGPCIPTPEEMGPVMGVLEAAAAWLYNFHESEEKRESDLVAAIENLLSYEEKP
jgi:hypothetical protein